jgi:hypothetical protein
VRFPRAAARHRRSRAASAKRPAGTMTGPREARWTGTGEMQLTPAKAASQEARAGAERRRWFAAASAAVERRQASAPLPALSHAREAKEIRRAAASADADGRLRVCRRFAFLIFMSRARDRDGAGTTSGGHPTGSVPEFFVLLRAKLGRCRAARTLLFSPSPGGGGSRSAGARGGVRRMHFVARMNQRVRPEVAGPMTGSVKSGRGLRA